MPARLTDSDNRSPRVISKRCLKPSLVLAASNAARLRRKSPRITSPRARKMSNFSCSDSGMFMYFTYFQNGVSSRSVTL